MKTFLVRKLENVTGKADDPLDEVALGVFRKFEHHDVSPPDRVDWQPGVLDRRQCRRDQITIDRR